MKRIIYLALGLILLILLAWWAFNLTSTAGKSDADVAIFNFEIKDTSSIDRIIITEPSGTEMELVRNGKKWTDKTGGCVQQSPVANLLDAAFNIRLKGYVPDNAVKNVTTRMATIGVKVQYFQKGEWSKTWYIGSSTPDHYGTYMLVESAGAGKSEQPVIMEIKGLNGIIGPRFFADPRRWICTEVFSLKMEDIALVNVKDIAHPERSFEVKKQGKGYNVTSNGQRFPAIDTNLVYRYLMNYKQIHFEYPNFELTEKQVDSIKRSRPFTILTVKTTDGNTRTLKMFRRKADPGVGATVDDFGDEVTHDVNRFWCLLPNGQLVKCQYYVFGPLLMGKIYFSYRQGVVSKQ